MKVGRMPNYHCHAGLVMETPGADALWNLTLPLGSPHTCSVFKKNHEQGISWSKPHRQVTSGPLACHSPVECSNLKVYHTITCFGTL